MLQWDIPAEVTVVTSRECSRGSAPGVRAIKGSESREEI